MQAAIEARKTEQAAKLAEQLAKRQGSVPAPAKPAAPPPKPATMRPAVPAARTPPPAPAKAAAPAPPMRQASVPKAAPVAKEVGGSLSMRT